MPSKKKSIEDHIREERDKVLKDFSGPMTPKMKMFKELELTSWNKQVVNSLKFVMTKRKNDLIDRRK